VGFEPLLQSLHSEVARHLLPGRAFTLRPYKLNIYSSGGHFARHVDTPLGDTAEEHASMLGTLVLQLPCAAQADLCFSVGNSSGAALAAAGDDKFRRLGLATFAGRVVDAPLLSGCVAWLECRVIPWPAVQTAHDLFLAEVVAAQADGRVFAHGRWQFDAAPPDLRTLHHLGGGRFMLPGLAVQGQMLPGLQTGPAAG
jgi:hypothetical protein